MTMKNFLIASSSGTAYVNWLLKEMNKHSALTITFILAVYLLPMPLLMAQENNSLEWQETLYHLGEIEEDGGVVTHTFCFVNHLSHAVAISSVHSSCGCTTADYSKEPVPPGQRGFVEVSYNPAGRPGGFNRTIRVHFSGMSHATFLRITGNVKSGRLRKFAGYPFTLGDLQLKSLTLNFSPLRTGEQQMQSLLVVNQGQQALNVEIRSLDKSFSASLSPSPLPTEMKGEIQVTRRESVNIEKTDRVKVRLVEDMEHSTAESLILLLEVERIRVPNR